MKYEIQCENKTSKGWNINKLNCINLFYFERESERCDCSSICCGMRAAYESNQSNKLTNDIIPQFMVYSKSELQNHDRWIKRREGQKNIPDAEHVVPELASRILQIAPLFCWIELVTPTLLLSLACPWSSRLEHLDE